MFHIIYSSSMENLHGFSFGFQFLGAILNDVRTAPAQMFGFETG